ncbi:MAG: tetratricopeptide repeat protein [Candidatus Omnitrophota bacterium]
MKTKYIYIIIILFTTLFFINAMEARALTEKKELYVAEQSFEDGFYDVSIDKLKAFIEHFSKSDNKNYAYILLGRCYYEKKLFHLALGEFEKVVSSADSDGKDKALYWMGRIYLENKDLNVARECFKKVIENFSDSKITGYTYYYSAVINNLTGNYEEAKKKSEFIIKKYQDSEIYSLALIELSKSLYGLKNFDEADKILTDYLKNFPESEVKDKIYFQLGGNKFLAGDFLNAVVLYRKAVEINPAGEKTEEALKKIGIAFFELKKYDDAVFAFDELIKTYPSSTFLKEVIFIKARSLEDAGHGNEAVVCFEKVIELEKDNPDYGWADDSSFHIADIYYKSGDCEKAAFFYASFKEKFAKSSLTEEVFYNLGWTYLKLKQYEQAIAEFQKLTRKEISKDEVLKVIALCRMGDTYLDKGGYDEAMAAYDEVLDKYPNSFYSDYAQYQLAVVLEKKGFFNEAIIALNNLTTNFKKSRILDQAHYLLALLYLKEGKYQKSFDNYYAIESGFPNSQYKELSILGQGYCWYNLREFEKAVEVFKRFEKEFADSEYAERAKFESAQALFAWGKEKEAKDKFIQLLKKCQDAEIKNETILWLAQYEFNCGNYDAAKEQFLLLSAETNSNYFKSLAYYWLAKIAYLKGDKENSLGFLETAFNLCADEEFKQKINFEKARVLSELARFDQALNIYADIIQKYPDGNLVLLSYKKKADIELSQNKFDLARQDYKAALTEVRSDFNAEIQFQIGKTYLAESDDGNALNELLNVVYIYGASEFWKEKALLDIADIYYKQGNSHEAQKIYLKLSVSEGEVAQFAKERINEFNAGNL